MEPAQIALVYLLGVLTSFSPCYLPVLPIMLAYITRGSFGRGVAACVLFAAGASISTALYGVLAASSASFLGHVAALGFTQLTIYTGYLLVGLGLVQFTPIKDVFALTPTLAPKVQRASVASAFVLGLVFSLAAAPCSFTPLVAFLSTAAVEGARGGEVFAVAAAFAGGIGSSLLALGLSSLLLGREFFGRLSRSALAKYHAQVTGILLVALGVFTIVSTENYLLAAPRIAYSFINFTSALGALTGALAATSIIRLGFLLESPTPVMLGVGLALLSIDRATEFFSMLGFEAPELYLREVSGMLILAALSAFSAGKYSTAPLPLSAAWSELLTLTEVFGWLAVWVRRDGHALFAVLYLAFDLIEHIARVLPGEAMLLIAPLSLVLQLSVLPLWRKLSLKTETLKLLEQP
uniref:Cytochrome C biogenesis protein transmembrane domain-containing protein n=1 Tax=Thermofilum pendens TaxID=2269 RepID=A0A7C3SP05_THEPE